MLAVRVVLSGFELLLDRPLTVAAGFAAGIFARRR